MWPWFWAGWAAVGIVVEAAALHGRRHPKDTLSQNIQWLVLRPGVRRASLVVYLAGAVWFADHIWG